MKKKFNVKLTVLLVSLFLGLILLILGNKNKYCLSFGLIILGFSLFFYTVLKNRKQNELLKNIQLEIEELDMSNPEHIAVLGELYRLRVKTKRQLIGTNIAFSLCAIILVVLGICSFL